MAKEMFSFCLLSMIFFCISIKISLSDIFLNLRFFIGICLIILRNIFLPLKAYILKDYFFSNEKTNKLFIKITKEQKYDSDLTTR